MKSRSLLKLCLLFICSVFFVLSALIVSQNAYAFTTVQLNDATVIDIGSSSSTYKFTEKGLNAMADIAGYNTDSSKSHLQEMMDAATVAGTALTPKFSNTVVQLGTDQNTNAALKWTPVYLSQDDKGNATLTLWLATDIYTSSWSDGTYSTSATGKDFEGADGTIRKIYSNTYDGSFIRHKLNGKTGWTTSWGIGNSQANANANIGTMVSDFYGSGALASYVTTPANVSWQANAGYMKNDPEWVDGSVDTEEDPPKGTFVNYPSDWLNDNIWLPSIYEVYDNTLNPNSGKWRFINNGGLWQVNNGNVCAINNSYSWARSVYVGDYSYSCVLHSNGSVTYHYVTDKHGVRPAIHINLTAVAAAAEPEHKHVWQSANTDGWVETTPATCVAQGEEERVCTAAGCTLTGGKETRKTAIDPTAHDFTGAPWKSDGINHWHECTLCGAKDTLVAHTAGAAATCDTDQICTVCNHVLQAKLGHDWDTKWSSDSSGHWHQCLRAGCTEKQDDAAHNPDRVAADCEHAQVCTVCSFEMAAKLGHNYSNNVVLPTCESGGYTEHVCSNCGDSYQDNIVAATGHSWGAPEWQWAGDYLTCKAKFTCSTCSKEQTETCSVTHSSATASCTVAGDTTHTASVTFDGKPYSDSQVESGTTLPHDWQLLSQTVAPDCENDGAGDFECSACHKTETRPIDKLGHDPVDDAEVPATCETDGRAAGKHCSRCNKTLKGLTVINALGHDWGAWVETKPATYTADGEERRECQRSGCTHFETNVIPMKVKVAITVTIQPASSEVGTALETLTATVTSGTLIEPADMPYTLSTNADINTMGTYTITGVCTDERYSITFIEGVYIVSKKADDPNGGGEIDLPVDINVEFKVTQSSTNNDYSDLDGMKQGYWAQLWYRNEDGTLGDEFTDKMNCILTLKIPTEIIEAIRGGEEINREKIAEELKVYYFVDGERFEVENFAIAMRDDESWQIKFNYNAKFRAEVVFNAPNAEEKSEPTAGIPWWVWLLVGLGCAAVVGVVIVIFVVAKKKNSAAVAEGAAYDDAELRAQLTEQDKKLDEIREIVDGGFNDIVDDE